MKINTGLYALFNPENSKDIKNSKKIVKTNSSNESFDSFEISAGFQECLNEAQVIASQVKEPASEEKIAKLRAEIGSGSYHVDCHRLALNMIDLA